MAMVAAIPIGVRDGDGFASDRQTGDYEGSVAPKCVPH